MRKELLIGCGYRKAKSMSIGAEHANWTNLVTADINPACQPDVVLDLEHTPYPFRDNCVDEIHAVEVLEHLGTQGDWRAMFDQFYELWRILRPDGILFGTVPTWQSMWAWGDPSHRRIINEGTLVFFSQRAYREQLGKTPMTDFRWYWKGDFEVIGCQVMEQQPDHLMFALRAIKNGGERRE